MANNDEMPRLVRIGIDTRYPEKYLLADTVSGDIWVPGRQDGVHVWKAIGREDPRLEMLYRLLVSGTLP